MNKQSGFSLLEILIAMAIMAILGGVMVANLGGEADKAKFLKMKTDFKVIGSALMRYKNDNFMYPTTDQGLEALITKPAGSPEPKNYARDGYVESLAMDPWGNPYQYTYPGENGRFDVYSFGGDGEEGGEGLGTDIGNWNVEEAMKAAMTNEEE